jgi:hypothetical protein
MQTRSLQRLAEMRVALGLVLAFSSAGCESFKKKAPPPLPQPKIEASNYKPAERPVTRQLPAFGMGSPQVGEGPSESEPVVAVNPTVAQGAAGSGTLNGHPNGLNRATLNAAIQGTMASLASCFTPSAQSPMVAVSFEADPAGRASLVRVSGAPPDAERCVRNIIQGMRFSRFEGNGVHVDLPLTFHQVGRSQPSAPANQPPPAEPPLNIEP